MASSSSSSAAVGMHYCAHCGSGCPATCYRSHRAQYSCHNGDCAGHAPAPCAACQASPGHLAAARDGQGRAGYRCTLCGSFCVRDCYRAHAGIFKCHDDACVGHLSVPCRCRPPAGEVAGAGAGSGAGAGPAGAGFGTGAAAAHNLPNAQNPEQAAQLAFSSPSNPTTGVKREPNDNNTIDLTRVSSPLPDDKKMPSTNLHRTMSLNPSNEQQRRQRDDAKGNDAKGDDDKPDDVAEPDDGKGDTLPYAWVETNFGQRSSDAIPGDAMRSNLLAATVTVGDRGPGAPSLYKVLDGLYVGVGAECVANEQFLVECGITAVVTALPAPVSTDPSHPLLRVVRLQDRLFLRARDTTTQDLMQFFPGLCQFLDDRLRPGFVPGNDDDDTNAPAGVQERPGQASSAAADEAADKPTAAKKKKKNKGKGKRKGKGKAKASNPEDQQPQQGRDEQPQQAEDQVQQAQQAQVQVQQAQVQQPKQPQPQPQPAQAERKRKHRVLIFCEGNLSRSSSLAAAYVMYRQRKNDNEALNLVLRRTGYTGWPNVAFQAQLKLWWDIKFKLYCVEMFKVPCDEYENYRHRLSLERALQACGKDE